MYLRMENLYSRSRPYKNLGCHGGDMRVLILIVLWKTWWISVARRTESVIATGHELTVKVSSIELARNRRKFFVHMALSNSTKWRCCLSLLNVNESMWQLLQPGCITRTARWVLTIDTCQRAHTSRALSSVELAASAHHCSGPGRAVGPACVCVRLEAV